MAKYCIKCNESINEKGKYAMIITKIGDRIIEFECFHIECWKKFFEENVQIEVKKKLKKKIYNI